MVTLESIFERNNMNLAYKRVVANKGSAGVDAMEVQDFREHLKWHGPELVASIKEGSYVGNPHGDRPLGTTMRGTKTIGGV